ncbi:UDP-N-acetylmuramate--L-alanine ligase [Candidatus Uhrbacteria bacterium]|nr:UDP-N-acetylmuramate--L-alanine ligase [Candidatus Uhrbacteria bacterium]
MNISTAQKIHCIGIGGIGVSALAQLWRAQGKQVSGSDAEESEITKTLESDGIQVFSSQSSVHSSQLLNGVNLVIYSDAVPEDHPERAAARTRGIPELSYAQALGQVSCEFRTIVVTGTHGKSTTTAMLGLILEAAGMDPLVIVGSKVREWGNSNIRIPQMAAPANYADISSVQSAARSASARFFIVEGDDYRDHFLELSPYAVVVTSIEWDHPDYFRDLEQTVESFQKLVKKVPAEGLVVMNEDDAGCSILISRHPERSAEYGVEGSHTLPSARYEISRFARNDKVGEKRITYGHSSEIFGTLQLQVPGEFNRYNATAAATAAMELGVPCEVAESAVRDFRGVWRRFEIVGTMSAVHNSPQPSLNLREGDRSIPPLKVRGGRGSYESSGEILVISDYAHHPTAIRETMKAAREAYPGRRLVLVFQPHQHSRTKHLFNDFVEVLKDAADLVIVSEIYAVKGRMEERDVNSRMLVDKITQMPPAPDYADVRYGGNLEETKQLLLQLAQPNDVVIVMGAGDIDNIARELTSK